ncbi:hypothetical protein [Kitasatospora sp. MBT63]|uniref:hypothetical protein n=1 Tax=Kitasatospora sp. MBT63 TaxID=1444768 RepID=UPI0009E9C568|nr:hypothetical protein [Kitasatospora sp. MBT63]
MHADAPRLQAISMSGYRKALIELALRQALRSRCRYRVGAVLGAGNRVLAASPNLRRNNPVVDFRHATFHAEEAVLRRSRPLPGSVLYIARVSRAEIPAIARPCPRCQRNLAAAGITRAYYTAGPDLVQMIDIAAIKPLP